jgi:hypothetical protein
MSIDEWKVEQEEDEEMKEEIHSPYVPHLWRSVPEYMWGL